MKVSLLALFVTASIAAYSCNSPEKKGEATTETNPRQTNVETNSEQTTKTSVVSVVNTEDTIPSSTTDEARKQVLITTSFGEIKIELYNETPKHRDNFIKLVKKGFYDSTLFHRVMARFMVQGGDPNSKGAASGTPLGNGGPGYTIPAEFDSSLLHKKGALSAARQGDNVNPRRESSGSQFYIVQNGVYTTESLNKLEQQMRTKFTTAQRAIYTTVGGTPHLDFQYTVFGEVISGLDVVDKIAAVSVDRMSRPTADIMMTMKMIE